MKKIISIIAPAYNEQNLLPEFVQELTSYLRKTWPNYELLIIENGSQDKTLKIASEISKKNKKVVVYHLSQPAFGQAIIYGLRKARGEYIVIFNIDFWDRRFIDLAQKDLLGNDIITGSKNLSDSYDQRPLSRQLVTKGFNFLLKVIFGYRGTDTHGIKVFRRKTVLPIVRKCKTKTGIFDSELLVRIQRAGLKILELPVEIMEKRPNRFGLKRILETPKDLLKLYLALRS